MDISGLLRVSSQSLKNESSSPDVTSSGRLSPAGNETVLPSRTSSSELPLSSSAITIETITPKDTNVEALKYQQGWALHQPEESDTYDRNALIAAELQNQVVSERFSATGLLAGLWDLDLSQESYFDGARYFSGYSTTDAKGNVPELNYSDLGRKQTTASFSLDIQTKDGDKVSIVVGGEKGFSSGYLFTGASFSFDVDGELDEDEMDAIRSLAMALGNSSDAYFTGHGTAKLGGLDSFDRDELSGFDLTLKSEKYQTTADFSFQVDEHSGNQTLKATQLGMRFEFTVDTDNQWVDSDYLTSDQTQSYLALIESTANDYKMDLVSKKEAADFLKDSFLSVMNIGLNSAVDQKDKAGSSAYVLNESQTDTAQGLVSGLPDFEGEIFGTNDINPNPEKMLERSFMSLALQQKTQVSALYSKGDELANIQQESSYVKDVRQHKPLDYLKYADFKNQNYQYETLKEEGSLDRSMTMDGLGKLVAATVDHEETRELIKTEYEFGKVTDTYQEKDGAVQSLITNHLDTLKSDAQDRQLGLYSMIDQLTRKES